MFRIGQGGDSTRYSDLNVVGGGGSLGVKEKITYRGFHKKGVCALGSDR